MVHSCSVFACGARRGLRLPQSTRQGGKGGAAEVPQPTEPEGRGRRERKPSACGAAGESPCSSVVFCARSSSESVRVRPWLFSLPAALHALGFAALLAKNIHEYTYNYLWFIRVLFSPAARGGDCGCRSLHDREGREGLRRYRSLRNLREGGGGKESRARVAPQAKVRVRP